MKEYWTSIEDLEPQDEEAAKPKGHGFSDVLEVGKSNRRDFLKFFGFSVASAAVIAGCQKPVNKAIPLLVQPEEVSPGIANYYASTFFDGHEPVGIVVKVRDGRPIKVEGNELSALTLGGTSAKVQASLLNLYDESRPQNAMFKGESVSWDKVLADITTQLQALKGQGEVTLITQTVIQPEVRQIIDQLKSKYPNLAHLQYDAISYSGLRNAYGLAVGSDALPSFELQNAEVLVAFNADFLGTWLEPVRFTKQYVKRRKLSDGEKSMSQHIHFESTMSLTGSNADIRVPIKPSEEATTIVALYNALLQHAGLSSVADVAISPEVQKTADLLWEHKGKGLVLSGSNDVNVQTVVIAINQLIGAFGKTVVTDKKLSINQGDDVAFADWLQRLADGKVKGVLFCQVNPLYNHPLQKTIEEGLKKVSLKVAITGQQDETSLACDYVLGTHHFLESWNHYEPVSGTHLLAQPTINPLFDTLQPEEVLMRLANIDGSYYDFIRKNILQDIYPKVSGFASANTFWDQVLHDGFVTVDAKENFNVDLSTANISQAVSAIANQPKADSGFELYLYRNVAMDDGHWANNPWLQELPDPVSKVCWDNYLAVSPFDAKLRGWNNGDLVKFAGVELAVLVQPGQARNTLALALGYGRRSAGTVATGVGVNGFVMATIVNNYRQYVGSISDVQLTGSTYELAATQSHHSMEQRPIVRETTLDKYLDDPASGNEMHAETEKLLVSLYEKHVYKGHHWAMVIDLNSCIGCNACVVACSAENNVPVVGRNEVRRSHEMHWIRIDRYYSGDAENPQVVRQPVMCQHCDNAPCENVCPVSATSHSSEGLNQMAYNRCIGTRYCNNNCPYKVRRFNWYDYNGADAIQGNTHDFAGMTLDLKRMVLNPDVTVRAKGVIEKCSFCVQRIQEKKLDAKADGHPLRDGAIQTACQQSCPANAIVFGDLNDENSRVAQLMKEARRYHLLEELKTLPSVAYLTKVRNIDKTFI
jgi:Fe-S-cluster-containing dehydrogenase component/anaerobic selenocysteine-containing dehydrogenase